MRRWVHWDTLGRRGQLSTVHGSTRMPMQGSFEVFFALIGHVYLFVWQRYDVTTSLSEAVKRNFLTCWLTKLKLNFRLLSWWRRLGKKKGIQLVLFGNPAQLDYFLKRMLIKQKKWKWLWMKLKIRRLTFKNCKHEQSTLCTPHRKSRSCDPAIFRKFISWSQN